MNFTVYGRILMERMAALVIGARCPQCGVRQQPKSWVSRRGTVERYFTCCKTTVPWQAADGKVGDPPPPGEQLKRIVSAAG